MGDRPLSTELPAPTCPPPRRSALSSSSRPLMPSQGARREKGEGNEEDEVLERVPSPCRSHPS
jgi:hypothetical protein